MSTCDISKNERIVKIFKHFMTKFHELPEQPTYGKMYGVSLRLIEPLNYFETHYWRFRQTYFFENN